MTTNSSIRVTELPNGLKVATDHMPGVETVSLGMWVGVGTRDEEPKVNGIAHLLEHMAFKGTRRRSARDIAEVIENVGGHLNAYTTREQTAYYAKVLAEDAPLAVDILGDILQHSVFDAEELKRERAVVLQEIGQASDTPDDIIFDHFQAAAFPDQSLGRPVLGTSEIVSRLGRKDLTHYMDSHYGTRSMVAVAAGRIDHDRFVEEISRAFGDLPARNAANDSASAYKGGSYAEERDLEQVHFVLGFPGVASDSPDYYAESVYSMAMGGGMSSRLFQEIREKRGLVYSIYSFASSYRDGGLFGIYAGTGEGELAELIPVVCGELQAAVDGISQEEIDRAKAQLRAGAMMSRESTTARAETLAQNLMIFGRPLSLEEQLVKLAEVTPQDVRRIAHRTATSIPTVATLGPAGGIDPMAEVRRHLA